MTLLTPTDSRYYIKPRAVSFAENDLGDVNRVYVSIASGTTIMVYVPEDNLIPYDDDKEYQKWVLTGYPTKLATSDAYYIYARLSRSDNRAIILFSTKKYKVDGSVEGEETGTQEEEKAESPYFYIPIGSLTSSEDKEGKEIPRILTFDSGKLSTPDNSYTKDEIIGGYLSSKIDDTASGLIRFKKGISLPTGELQLEYKAVDTSGEWTFNAGIYAEKAGAYVLGQQVAATGALASPFFDLEGADYIKFSLIAPSATDSKVGLVFYDAEEKAIEGVYTHSQEADGYIDREVLVPPGATMVRYTVWLEITGEYLQLGYIPNEVKTHILSSALTSLQLLEKKEDVEEAKKLFTENTVLTAKAIQEAFVSKLYDDTAKGIITFNKGVKLPAGEQTVEYKPFDLSALGIVTRGVGIFADSTDAAQFGGMVGTEADMVSTDYIDLQKADYIDISLLAAQDEASRMGLVFYNKDQEPVKGYYVSGQEADGYVPSKIAVPEAATQIRFSAWSMGDEALYLKLGYFTDTINTSLISSLIKADGVEKNEFTENALLTAAAFAKLFKLTKDEQGSYYIRTPYPFASDKTVSSLCVGKDGEGEASALSALYKLVDVLRDGENDKVSGAEDGNVLMFDAATGKWFGKKVDIPDVDFTEVNGKIADLQGQLNTLVSGNASSAIESFNEVVAFLKDVEDTDTLEGILAGKQNKITETNKLAYSLISGTPTKLSDFEDDIVKGKYQPLIDATNKLDYSLISNTPSLADFMGSSVIGGTASSENFAAVYWDGSAWKTRTIYKWALAAAKPSYTTSEVTEGTRLYFTDDRAKSALKSTTDALSDRIAVFEKMFQWGDGDGSHIKTPYSFVSDKTVSSLGVGSDGTGGLSYDRLDSWDNYDADAGAVLSATLGYELKQAIENIDLGDFDLTDYLTKEEASKTYQPLITDLATIRANAVLGKEAQSWGDHKKGGYALAASLAAVATTGSYSDLKNVPTKLSDFTDDVVSGKYQTLISATNKLAYSLISGTPTKLSDFEDDIVKGKYQPLISETNKLAYTLLDGAPTALKNPNALKFGSKSYDGSEEKTITADDLGALTEHQTIYALTIKDDAGKAQLTYTPNVKAGEITLTKAMVGLGLVENTALSTWKGTTNITTLGTVTSGTWNATKIANDYIANPHVTIAGNKVNLGGSLSVETLQTSLDIVTLSTEQTITGKKTFTKQAVFYNGIQIGKDNDCAFLWWDGEALRVNKPFASDSTVSSLGVGEDGEISGDVIDLTNVVSNIIPAGNLSIGSEEKPWENGYFSHLYVGGKSITELLVDSDSFTNLSARVDVAEDNIDALGLKIQGVESNYAQKATTLDGYGLQESLKDLNSPTSNTFFKTSDTTPQHAPVSNWGVGLTLAYNNDGAYQTQLFLSRGHLYTRQETGSRWSEWHTVLDSSNFSDYALPLSGGTIKGLLTLTAQENKDTPLQLIGYNGAFVRFYNVGELLGYIGLDANGNTAIYKGETYQGEIIHSGNIGSQSVSYATSAGNADTLDGLHADSFDKVYTSSFTVTESGWYRLVNVPALAQNLSWKDKYIVVNTVNTAGSSACSTSFKILYSTQDGWSYYANNEFIVIPLTRTNAKSVGNVRLLSATGYNARYIDVYIALPSGTTAIGVTIRSNIPSNHLASTATLSFDNVSSFAIIERNADSYSSRAIGGLIAEKATVLSTARTLWGQSFDGSANISGNLTDVRNIIGTAGISINTTGLNGILLRYNSNNATSVALYSTAFRPLDEANGVFDLGTSTARWKGIYGQTLSLSGHVYLLNDRYIYGTLSDGSTLVGLMTLGSTNNFLIGQNVAKSGHSTNIYGNTISLAYGTVGSTSNTALFVNSDGKVGINTNTPTYRLDVDGTFGVTGLSTFKNDISYNSSDATLKIYDIDVDSNNFENEAVAIQTCFDQQDPETSGYVTQYEYRCNLLLQPRGGQVYVGYTPTSYQWQYALNVGQAVRLYGDANSTNAPEILFYRDGLSSWKIINDSGGLYLQNNYTTAVQSSYFNVLTLAYNTGNATLKGSLTTGGSILPSADGILNLGSNAAKWSNAYINTVRTTKLFIGDAEIYCDADGVLRTNASFASDRTVSSLGVGSDDEGNIGGVIDLTNVVTSIVPSMDGLNLGAAASRWDVLYAKSMNITDSVVFATSSSVIAYGTFKAASIDGDLIPAVDGEYNIGSPSMGWNEIYANDVEASVITEGGLRVATKNWVENNYVAIAGQQTITGLKYFSQVPAIDLGTSKLLLATMNDVPSITPLQDSGTEIARIDLGGKQVFLYAPNVNIPSLEGYATTSYVENAIKDLSLGTASKKDWTGTAATDQSSLVTEDWVKAKIDNLNIPDVSGFATTDDLDDYFPLSGGKTITGKVTISSSGSLEVQGNVYVGGTLYNGLNTNDPYAAQSWVRGLGILTGGSQTQTSNADGGNNIFTFTKSDGSTATFIVKNGSKGADGIDGIDGIDGTSVTITKLQQNNTAGGTSVITFSDGNTLSIKNGTNGVNATTTAIATEDRSGLMSSDMVRKLNTVDDLSGALEGLSYLSDVEGIDANPVVNSKNLVTSGGVYSYVLQEINTINESLAVVATTGKYDDLSGTPTLGTAASKGFTTSVTNGSTDLITSGGVYTKLSDYVLVDTFVELDNQVGTMVSTVSVHEGKWYNLTTSTGLASGYIKQLKADTLDLGGSTVATMDDLDGYLPLSGGTISGVVTLDNYTNSYRYISFKNNRVGSEGYADSIINITDGSGSSVGSLGMYGAGAVSYYYLGHNSYNGNNLRVYADKLTFGNNTILHAGNYTNFALSKDGGTISGNLTVAGTLSIGSTRLNVGSTTLHGDVSLQYGTLTITHGTIGSSYWSITNEGEASFTSVNQTSDERLKNILNGDFRLSLATMANAPLVIFDWNNRSNKKHNVGTLAQYWQGALPEVVSKTQNGTLALAYGELGVAMGISLANILEDTNGRVATVEEEIKTLKEENKRLKERVAELEAA